ncbi:MAG: hypothetical protein M3Z03_14345 [Actinomycetota bacterium]|nr:hypothetical protein [Actinomycetota bacterium]
MAVEGLIGRSTPSRSIRATSTAGASRPMAVERFVDGPWDLTDLVSLTSFALIGLFGLIAASIGARSVDSFAAQQGWAAAGVASIGLAFVGMVSWIKAGLRRIREIQADAVDELSHLVMPIDATRSRPAIASDQLVVAPGNERPAEVVTGPGMSRYHHPRCVFAAGKQVEAASPSSLTRSGLTPCEVCLP